ncbi:hypothetical protein J3Q64DRAFT_1763313 [Phycomyces blakesleeanus]|uniref:Uncharacterized protein n=1 Tax=Phycomyces blakesleeanus TaxID=4837 RepID=A0ABR3APK3_PHYBL
MPDVNSNTEFTFDYSRRSPVTYQSWKKLDGGKDNMSGLGRLLQFLLKDDGKNLYLYIGRSKEGYKVKASKTKVINECKQIFLDQGISRTTAQIKTKLNNLLNKKYRRAYNLWTESNESPFSGDRSESEKEELEKKCNEICQDFFKLKEILGERPEAPPVQVIKAPVIEVEKENPEPVAPQEVAAAVVVEEEEEADDDDDEDDDEEEEEEEELDEGENSDEDSSSPSLDNQPSSASSGRTRGKKRANSYLQVAEENKRNSQKRAKALEESVKKFNSAKIAMIKSQHAKELEARQRKDHLDADIKIIEMKAKLFGWSEEKIDEELLKCRNKSTC